MSVFKNQKQSYTLHCIKAYFPFLKGNRTYLYYLQQNVEQNAKEKGSSSRQDLIQINVHFFYLNKFIEDKDFIYFFIILLTQWLEDKIIFRTQDVCEERRKTL